MRNFSLLIAALLLAFNMVSCKDDKTSGEEDASGYVIKKIAVVLPMQDGQEAHWKRTLKQCAEDLKKAYRGQSVGFSLEYEWYDEATENVDDLADKLAKRQDIVAVIGGKYSDHAQTMATKLCNKSVKKPFFTLATTEELVRSFSDTGCLWALTETDLSQCETLLSLAYSYGGKRVALITNGKSMYGKTFVDWFGFQVTELDMESAGIFDYGNSSIRDAAVEAARSKADFLICAPSSIDDIKVIEDAMAEQAKTGEVAPPRCLYSDIAFGSNVLARLGSTIEGLEGVAVGSDPSSGFDVRYEATYKELPIGGEAQVYDAATILGYAFFIQHQTDTMSLNTAIKTLVDGRYEYDYSPTVEGMSSFISALAAGKYPDLRGVSGSLDFDKNVYTNVLSSTYYSYKVYGGKYIILDYISNNGAAHTTSSLANWNWKSTHVQDIDDKDVSGIVYPALHDKWALLVAASSGWDNYRHQADVFYIYQLLKKNGYTDDHIVLIAEDDIANNPNNPNKGYVAVRIGGENVRTGVEVDYHTSDLKPEDIKSILCGERSDRLKCVISADSTDNVFLFWSGHGLPGELEWLEEKKGFSKDLAKATFKAAAEKKCYRKMLCLIETCYAGSVLPAIKGLPGILALTASGANETSKAEVRNNDLGVWMSNRFTMTFQECVETNPQMSLRDLYYKLFTNTVGSHVTLFNANHYGNLYKNDIWEFL